MKKRYIVFVCISLIAYQFCLKEASADSTIENILKEFSAFVNTDGRSGFPVYSEVNEEKMQSKIRAVSLEMEGPIGFIGDFLEANENNGFCRYKHGAREKDACSVDFEARFMIEVPEGELADIGKILTKYFDAVVDMNKKKKFWEISTKILNTAESSNTKQNIVKQHNRVRSSNTYAVYDYMVKRISQDAAVMYGVGKDFSEIDEKLLEKLFKNETEREMYMGKEANKFAGMTLVKRVKRKGRQYYAFYSIYSTELKGEAECKVVKGGFINMGEINMIEHECNKAVIGYVKSTADNNRKIPLFSNNRELMEALDMKLPPANWITDEDDGLM